METPFWKTKTLEAMSPAETGMDEPSNASVLASSPARTAPDATVGQPTGGMGFQPQVTPIGEEALWFHNALLMPLITASGWSMHSMASMPSPPFPACR